jgi:hypothetical protein
MFWRIGFSVIFLACLLSSIFQIERVDVITSDECLRDYTFIWTDSVNKYLAAHPNICDRYIIFCSFLMDFMMLNFFTWWLLKWKSFRLIIAYILFFGTRSVIQVKNIHLCSNI